MRVFISYGSQDRSVARRIEAALTNRRTDVTCFLDERGLTGGAYWIPRLSNELAGADAVLLLVGARVGAWQELEYYEALRLSRQPERDGRPRIIPVVMAERAPGLPFLATLHQLFSGDPTTQHSLSAIERALQEGIAGDSPEPWRLFQPYKGLPDGLGVLAQSAVRPRFIIVGGKLAKDPAQVSLSEHDHVVNTFPSDRADQSLRATACL